MSTDMDAPAGPPVWIGQSPVMQWIRTQLKEVAQTDLPVLLLGEPGVGKGLAARLVHALSERRDHAFVQVDCGVLHSSLAENELFGSESEGRSGRPGQVERAAQGTLFLDEIEALPPVVQARLLDLLGGRREGAGTGDGRGGVFQARVIAATSQPLDRLAKMGKFSAPLYYRLGIAPVRIPPLRERRKDIPSLAAHFVSQCAARMGRAAPRFNPAALAALLAHAWPGNVWELKRVLERAVVMVGGEEIRPEHIAQPLQVVSEGGGGALLGFDPSFPDNCLTMN
jgi:DNA-binding NtrC family response regulator